MPSPERIVLPHSYRTIDPAVRRELVDHAAADGFPLTGVLYRPPRRDPDVVVLAMHPRADFTHPHAIPRIVDAGPHSARQCFRVNTHRSELVNREEATVLADPLLLIHRGSWRSDSNRQRHHRHDWTEDEQA